LKKLRWWSGILDGLLRVIFATVNTAAGAAGGIEVVAFVAGVEIRWLPGLFPDAVTRRRRSRW
jgi:hypothetical protein